MKQSIIKWQTGEPKNIGTYLVTTKSGLVRTVYWNGNFWIINDLACNPNIIIAWCKQTNIEPYKEEEV